MTEFERLVRAMSQGNFSPREALQNRDLMDGKVVRGSDGNRWRMQKVSVRRGQVRFQVWKDERPYGLIFDVAERNWYGETEGVDKNVMAAVEEIWW